MKELEQRKEQQQKMQSLLLSSSFSSCDCMGSIIMFNGITHLDWNIYIQTYHQYDGIEDYFILSHILFVSLDILLHCSLLMLVCVMWILEAEPRSYKIFLLHNAQFAHTYFLFSEF